MHSILLCTTLMVTFAPLLHAMRGTSSDDPVGRPEVNITATIEDTSGNRFFVENLAMGKPTQTKMVEIYLEPHDATFDPKMNTMFVDISKLASIVPEKRVGRMALRRYSNIEYVPVYVQFAGEAPEENEPIYLIESSREIFCTIRTKEGVVVPKTLRIKAISKLIIGTTHPQDPPAEERAAHILKERQEHACAQAFTALHTLEEEIRALPSRHRGKLPMLVEVLKQQLGTICNP